MPSATSSSPTPTPNVRNPEKAAQYFKEAAEIYPKSPFLGLSVVNEATARAQQGDFDGALKTYRDFLATNPPAEVGAVAQLGIGNVFKEQGKWDEAIAAYQELADEIPASRPSRGSRVLGRRRHPAKG